MARIFATYDKINFLFYCIKLFGSKVHVYIRAGQIE